MPRYFDMEKEKLYIVSQFIRNIIQAFGKDVLIYSSYDSKDCFVSFFSIYNERNGEKIYISTVESLYLYLRLHVYSEIDVFLLLFLEKRNLHNVEVKEILQLLNISLEHFREIEEGIKILNIIQRKAVSKKLSINEFTIKEFFVANFKLIK